MKSVSDLTVCVVDHGRFFHVAQRMARDCDRVYYTSPEERDCPTIKEGCVGDGFDNITRVKDLFEVKRDCDLFVFPDIGFAPVQNELIEQGYPVWGARDGDSLEINRGDFLKALKELGMSIPDYKVVRGLTNLGVYLKDKKDKWIKISKWRGDFETLHWRSWREDECVLDYYRCKFGPLKELPVFYVFDAIDSVVEDGIDTHCIDGQLPGTCLHAMECKDRSLIGTMTAFKDIPEVVREVSEVFAEKLKEFGYRSFFSTEVRVTESSEAFFIDPTLRCGSPPSQVQEELYENYSELIWAGANGECIDPEPTAPFGVQAIVKTSADDDSWEQMVIPKDIEQWFKAGFACRNGERICVPPGMVSHSLWLTAIGQTIKEAIENLNDHAKQLPDGLKCDTTSLAELLKEIEAAEEHGMEFTDQPVPDPAIVL